LSDLPMDRIRDRVAALPPNSAVLYAMLAMDAAGVPYELEKALASVRAAANAPVFGVFGSQLGQGIVGGPLLSLEDSARQAAQTGVRLLQGEKPSTIAIPPPEPAPFVYDWRELRRWNIDEARLPAGSIVRYRPPSQWAEHKGVILTASAVILAQTLTIAALLAARARRQRSEAALRESEERMNLAAEAANLGLWVWDIRRDEIWATVKCRALFGFTPDEPVTFADFAARVHPDDRPAMEKAARQALENKATYEAEYRACLPAGDTRWIGARGVATGNGAGPATSLLGVCLDLTGRKRADNEIQRQRAELAHVSRVSIMGELSASMAHELNQPLTAILTNAQAAQRFMAAGTADLDEFREILKDIAYDTTRARDVIRHLRALVKRSEPDFTQLDVGDTIREVVGFLHGDIVARNVRVGLELLPDLPPVHGDRIQLQQILINLLLNAFDALNGNPVAKRLVTVATAQESPQLVRVTVRDCGAGIPPNQLDSVFEPFFTTKQDGMGMGLSVTRSIVESHGGRIWAENNSAGGAAFHFTLPVVKTID
jgi:PAS domain S-box-containing protein